MSRQDTKKEVWNAVSSLLVAMGMALGGHRDGFLGETLLHGEETMQAARGAVLGALSLTKATVGA